MHSFKLCSFLIMTIHREGKMAGLKNFKIKYFVY